MSLGLEGALRDRLLHLVGDALRACEAEINRELADSPVQLVRDLGEHVALAGGKRLRPILVLLGAALGADPRRGARCGSGASWSSCTPRP